MIPLLLLGLSGCWLSERELVVKLEGESGPIEVLSIEPDFGTAAGGTEVTLHAEPVGGGVVVTFGGEEAELLSVDDGEIVVRTPEGEAGAVEVGLAWGAREGAVPAGYRYFTDGGGQYGAIGTVAWVDVVGTRTASFSDYGFGWLNVVEPIPYDYRALYGLEIDTCASGWSFPEALVELTDAQTVELTRGEGSTVTLSWSHRNSWYEGDLALETSEEGFFPDAEYDLEPIEGFPSFEVKSVVRTPEPFEVTRPDFDGGSVSRSGFEVAWTRPAEADLVLLRVELFDLDDFHVVEEVRCVVEDDGLFQVPSTVWQGWDDLYGVDLYVGRARLSDATLPHNASRSGMAGTWWVVGEAAAFPF